MGVNRSHHGASNGNSAKINSVTPIFSESYPILHKKGSNYKEFKKILWSRFYVITQNRIF